MAPIYADRHASEDLGHRMASLRWFLRFYQRRRPEVVAELRSQILPLFLEVMRFTIQGQQASSQELETYQEALRRWIDDFGLPKSEEMAAEAALTLLTPSPSGRLVFSWDSTQEIMRSLKRKGSPSYRYSHPFTFQAQGWTPAEESIEEAVDRLRDHFEKALAEHRAAWHQEQRIGVSLYALWKRDQKHVRHLRWLAHTQACPDLSRQEIATRYKCSIDKVRRGLQAAADFIGLPRESIHRAHPGRKPRPRSAC